tara:strand:- start:1287 stop:1508 length:222 start_codon:yes stop_codon:yes gene_type:complete
MNQGNHATLTTQIKAMKTQDIIKVRVTSIINDEHPEWGTFGVMEDLGSYYEILGNSGSRILSKTEADSFWSVV